MASEPALPTANLIVERGLDSVFIHTFAEPTQLVLNASGKSPRSGMRVGKDPLAGLEAERSWGPPASKSAIRVAVKDLIDMVGTITTAGCRAVAATAVPAPTDAPLLTEMRRLESLGEVRFVGKTNLHELAFGADGINPAYGTPTNPLDPGNVPGGSSSGSAVAVATGLADIALGSDTGGSIRIPAACCGIVGLKTTWGRIPVVGVWPLALFLDTVGPMARTVSETTHGLAMLDPSFSATGTQKIRIRTIGRIRLADTPIDPAIDAAVDAALLATGVAVLDITLPYWQEAHRAGITVLLAEAWRANRFLLEDPNLAALVHPVTNARLRLGEFISDAELSDAKLIRTQTAGELARLFERFDVLALPTLTMLPPKLEDAQTAPLTALTRFANLTGLPALSVPVPLVVKGAKTTKVGEVANSARRLELNPLEGLEAKRRQGPSAQSGVPTSMQLIGPMHREDLVLAAGLLVERSVAQVSR